MSEPLPRILVVDDEKDNVEALKRLLRKDFEILTAYDGEEALKVLQTSPELDVILSDQRMPGMSGSEFLGKAQDLDPVVTRVLLTGFSDLEAVIDAVNRGHIWRYIAKPWEPEDLKQALKQAAERTRLRRSLDQSRVELERALMELRAKDWSRERLLQILLHEFRTAPQILEGLRSLDPGGTDADARLRFIESLAERFQIMEKDIGALLADEKKFAQIPRARVQISQALKKANLSPERLFEGNEPALLANEDSLVEAFSHLHKMLSDNSAKIPAQVSLDLSRGTKPDLFVIFSVEGPASTPLLPVGLQDQKIEARLAWPVLLEPFVGTEDFKKHSTGLRVDSAQKVRLLAAMGGRSEFQINKAGNKIELLIAFKAS